MVFVSIVDVSLTVGVDIIRTEMVGLIQKDITIFS